MSKMLFFIFLVATAILQLAHAQLEYVNIQAGTGLHFVHPEVPAGIGDGTCYSLLASSFCRYFLNIKILASAISTLSLLLTYWYNELILGKIRLTLNF